MTVSFFGTALGSALGLLAWDQYRWPGVCVLAAGLAILAAVVFYATRKSSIKSTMKPA